MVPCRRSSYLGRLKSDSVDRAGSAAGYDRGATRSCAWPAPVLYCGATVAGLPLSAAGVTGMLRMATIRTARGSYRRGSSAAALKPGGITAPVPNAQAVPESPARSLACQSLTVTSVFISMPSTSASAHSQSSCSSLAKPCDSARR